MVAWPALAQAIVVALALACQVPKRDGTAVEVGAWPLLAATGVVVEERLEAGGEDVFTLDLPRDQYIELRVEQRGIDVVASVFEAEGGLISSSDVWRGTDGHEPVVLVGQSPDPVQLRIRPFLEEAEPGTYALVVHAWRPATFRDRLAAAATKAFAEAVRLEETGATAAAIDSYKDSWQAWKKAERPAEEGNVLNRLGLAYRRLGHGKVALQWYRRALSQWRVAGDQGGEATTSHNMGSVYWRLGEVGLALQAYEEALRLRRTENDLQGVAQTLNSLGRLFFERGEVTKALDRLHESLSLRIAVGDRYGEAATRFNLGWAYGELGRIEEAQEHLQSVLDTSRALSYREIEGKALNALAVAQVHAGELQHALAGYHQALALRRLDGDPEKIASTLLNIGRLYERLSDPERAAALYTEALTLTRNAGSVGLEARTLYLLGWLAASRGETATALEQLNESLRLGRRAEDISVEASVLDRLGEVHVKTGDYQEARGFLLRALQLRQQSRNPYDEASTLQRLGRVHMALGDPAQAESRFARALVLHRALGQPAGLARALYGRALVERQRGQLERAQRTVGSAVDHIESLRATLASPELRASFLGGQADYYRLSIDLLMEMAATEPHRGYQEAAYELSERARARSLLESLGESRNEVQRGVPPALQAKRHALEKQIRAAEWRRTTSGSDSGRDLDVKINDLLSRYEVLEGKIRAHSPTYAALTRPQVVDLNEVQQDLLDTESLLLHYSLGDERSFLWAVTHDSFSSFELAGRAEIESLALEVYRLLTARNRLVAGETIEQRHQRLKRTDAELLDRGGTLRQILLGPVAHLTPGRRLLLVTDGALRLIPLAALAIPHPAEPRGSPPLGLTNEVVYLPSASVVATLRQRSSSSISDRTIAIVADPVFAANDPRINSLKRHSGLRVAGLPLLTPGLGPTLRSARDAGLPSFRRLHFSRREAESIARLASFNRPLKVIDFRASRNTVTALPLERYRYLHFATHTLLNDRHSQLSAIVLSLVDPEGQPQDGFLRLRDILNLDLQAELVVLSGCRTALGKEVWGEGLLGLTNAFLLAGADQVLASVWQVDDRPTSELMGRFYQALLREELSPAAALRKAQVSLWQEGAPAYDWAGFVLQGDGS